MSDERPWDEASHPLLGLLAEVTGRLLALLLNAQRRSWTVSSDGEEALKRLHDDGEGVLVAFWHGKYPALFTLLTGYGGCVFASRSFRGAVIAALCRHLGFAAALISSHSGRRVLKQMRETLRQYRTAGIAVDGPLGPRHEVKSGVFRLASELNWPILPVSVASRPRRILRNRWDKMEVPRFFSRVVLVVGEPMVVPTRLSEEELPELKERLHAALQAAGSRAEGVLGTRR